MLLKNSMKGVLMKIGTVKTVEVKTSAKTNKPYAIITLNEVPGVEGFAYADTVVGEKVAYNVKLDIIGKIEERK